MPAERARRLWSLSALAVDPRLELMDDLFTDWMVGIQYYLRRATTTRRPHHLHRCPGSTALTQAQFWPERDFPEVYGDGRAVDSLSVASPTGTPPASSSATGQALHRPGGRPGGVGADQHHTAGELPTESRNSLVPTGIGPGPGGRADLQRDARRRHGRLRERRPTARTRSEPLPRRLCLHECSNLATMEGAKRVGREAANAILNAAASPARKGRDVHVVPSSGSPRPSRPRSPKPHRAGQPKVFDVPAGPTVHEPAQVTVRLLEARGVFSGALSHG